MGEKPAEQISFSLITSISPFPIRREFMSAVCGDEIILIGGYGTSSLNDVYAYRESTAVWSTLATAPWQARNFGSAVQMTYNSILLTGGSTATTDKNDVWSMQCNGIGISRTVSWNQITATAPWVIREGHATVKSPWSNNEIILMGGYSGGFLRNDVWSYNTGTAV